MPITSALDARALGEKHVHAEPRAAFAFAITPVISGDRTDVRQRSAEDENWDEVGELFAGRTMTTDLRRR